jgi:hypothetical protein
MKPEVIKRAVFSIQVCVPNAYTDDEVKRFADSENPAGTTHGWQVRKEGDEALKGCKERVQCASRAGCVHIMLDC